MPKVKTDFTWHGNEIQLRVHRAVNRASVAVAEDIVAGAKKNVHRLTGTLSRSIHAAPDEYTGGGDYELAKGEDLTAGELHLEIPTWKNGMASILVGSWIPYACVEESRHPYIYPAVEDAMGRVAGIYKQAFEEEGLSGIGVV